MLVLLSSHQCRSLLLCGRVPMLVLGILVCLRSDYFSRRASPVWGTDRVIDAHFAVSRAQARHVIYEEGLDDRVAEQLCG